MPAKARLIAFIECKFNSYFSYVRALELEDDSYLRGLLVGRAGNSPIVPVVLPRGLPADLDVVLRKLADAEIEVAHRYTWLGPDEVEQVRQRYHIEHSSDDPALDEAIDAMHNPMARECRLVFWLLEQPSGSDDDVQHQIRTVTTARGVNPAGIGRDSTQLTTSDERLADSALGG